jgi:hypothetical protein
MLAKRITVNATATKLYDAAVDARYGADVLFSNTSGVAIELGPSTVTFGTGYSVAAAASIRIQVNSDLYGIVSTGTGTSQLLIAPALAP